MKYLFNKYKEKKKTQHLFLYMSISYILVTLFILIYFSRKIDAFEKRVLTIDPNSGLVFYVEQAKYSLKHRVLEYESHIRLFLYLFYQFDQNTFLENMERALPLMSKVDYDNQLDYYRNNKILERLQSDDIILRIKINDVNVELRKDKYVGSFSLTQFYRSLSNDVERARSIKGTFYIEDALFRTKDNPHAGTIYNYVITERKNLEE